MGRKLFGSRPRPKKIQNLDTSIEYIQRWTISSESMRDFEKERKKEIYINILEKYL